jgi:L-threonylcarbamoyladenylate synthase
MKINRVKWQEHGIIERLIPVIKQGYVVVGTTDTVLGFLADTTHTGFEALNAIKKRTDKPYLLLIACKDVVQEFAEIINPTAQLLMDACWPGPLTIILRAKKELPAYLKGSDGTIALRVPAHAGLQRLLPHFKALFSTSANISGRPVPRTIDDIDPYILERCAYLIEDESEQKSEMPSTIIYCTLEKPVIIREGAITGHAIAHILSNH